MLAHARAAVSFAEGASAADLERDGRLRSAVLWNLSIVGEAASRLSEQAQAALPDLPLSEARRMRNALIHGYFEIDLDLVAQTVGVELPRLVASLEALLGNTPE